MIKITFDKNINLSLGMFNTDKTIEYFIEKSYKFWRYFKKIHCNNLEIGNLYVYVLA